MDKMNISISKTSVKAKSEQVHSKLEFENKDVNIMELSYLIGTGYSFCHNFGRTEFNISEKTKNNFKSADLIFIDKDGGEATMNETLDKCRYKPSLAYTTFSDNPSRFRLVYQLSRPITDVNEYSAVAREISSDIEGIDTKSYCADQYFMGSNATMPNFQYCVNSTVIDVDALGVEYTPYHQKCHYKSIKITTQNSYHCNDTFDELDEYADTELVKDYFSMSYLQFLGKYDLLLPEASPLPEVPDEQAYIHIPEDYVEIPRYWIKDSATHTTYVRRLKDGEHRKAKLATNARIRRFIYQQLQKCHYKSIKITTQNSYHCNDTFEEFSHILYTLVYELYYYIDNRKDIISKKELYAIARRAMNAELDKWQEYFSTLKPDSKFIVNPAYCKKYGLTKKKALPTARKQFNEDRIGELYDCSLTDKENLKIFEQYGLKCSLSTLIRFKKNNNLLKNKKRNEN